MSAEGLHHLAEHIGSASAENEAALFSEAMPLLAATPEEVARWQRYLHVCAFHELAVAIFTTLFPGRGFQFGTLAGPAPKAVANIWREGDAQSQLYQAATPALALLRAATTEAADAIHASAAAQCPACAGRGWFVTANARKQMCRHVRAVA